MPNPVKMWKPICLTEYILQNIVVGDMIWSLISYALLFLRNDKQSSDTYKEPRQTSNMELFAKTFSGLLGLFFNKIASRPKNLLKNSSWAAINYIRKKLHHWSLTGFWIPVWSPLINKISKSYGAFLVINLCKTHFR